MRLRIVAAVGLVAVAAGLAVAGWFALEAARGFAALLAVFAGGAAL